MRIMAQVCMVMNLDKCIGCHTCTVTCKQTWTNRPGTEYVYFNNVETKPGLGYPARYEDQEQWKGGWTLDKKGRLKLKAGSRLKKLASIFYNPDLPTIEDYHEPFSYDYAHLITAPAGTKAPSVSARSALTGREMNPTWGANWEDDLAGAPARALRDPNIVALPEGAAEKVRLDFESVFMFYLPRICEHCLNPSCVASCPSGAMYKREEDGIVLVDQDRCRGWRFCVSGCPYKKVYFNHRTGKAEKCTFCFPRIEAGLPTICSETCVGRLRYLGLVLYDADKVLAAAATTDEADLYEAQLGVFLDPDDPAVAAEAERQGIPHDWLAAARRSPTYALIARHRVALPLHPEYRTMPMVWYIPPLSPVADVTAAAGYDDADADSVFAAIDALRIPIEYLANLFTAGEVAPVRMALRRLAMVRAVMRAHQLGTHPAVDLAEVGLTEDDAEDLFRLLAIARYEDRYVVPPAHAEDAGRLLAQHDLSGCSLDSDGGPGMGGEGPATADVAGFHLRHDGSSDASVVGRDGHGRLHLRVAEHPSPGPLGPAGAGGTR
ncbi:MAG: nitrate reductase subunit beta [Actinomycetota bacterium]|jgi:nitrate reductase beta subunit|nr:nitrate reductase subunit beta [Actinomycetota bacterium]